MVLQGPDLEEASQRLLFPPAVVGKKGGDSTGDGRIVFLVV